MRSDLPALLGGTPVRPEGPPAWPFPDPDVHAALAAATASGAWGQYHGEHVRALEAELAAFHGVPHALTCASGTLAVEAALRALRVGPGDEVVMAAYDYEPTFLTIHALGATPVLIDVRPADWQLDPANLESAFSPKTKAVVCSHLHGGIVPMQAATDIARARGVGIVEDGAQATGATVEGKPAGTWGDVGTLSFGGSKLLTAGRGGALLFTDPQLYQRAKSWLHRGLQQWAPLSELQAAALRPQLRKLKEATRWRAERVRALLEALKPTSGLSCLANSFSGDPGGVAAYYKLGFRYDPVAFGLSRELFLKALRAEGIAFDAGFKALHVGRSPSRFRAVGELIHAAAAHERCVTLHHPVLSLGADAAPLVLPAQPPAPARGATADVQQVADAVAKVYRYRDEFPRADARG